MKDYCEDCRLPLTPQEIAESMREDGRCWSCSDSRTAITHSALITGLLERVRVLELRLGIEDKHD